MADLVLDTGRVNVSMFSIDTWAPGQSDVVLPYVPALDAAGPRATGWSGPVRFASTVRDPGGLGASDEYRLDLDAEMRGNRHRLRLPLSGTRYARYADAPGAATARVTSARLAAEACEVTITPADFGAWALKPKGWLNLGDRLYFVVSVAGNTLMVLPRILPRAIARPRGLQAITGWPAGAQAFGLGQYRGALYASYYIQTLDSTRIYVVDPHTGRHRIAIDRVAGAVGRQAGGTGLGSAYGHMWATAGVRPTSDGANDGSGYLYLCTLDSADPEKNQARLMLTLTGAGAHVIHGVSQAQLTGDDDPKIYVGTTAGLYKLKAGKVLPGVNSAEAVIDSWDNWFELAQAVPGLAGLSPPPTPGGPLYLVARGEVKTWDGVTLETLYSGTLGSLQVPAPSLMRSRAIEWYNGEFLVQLLGGGGHAPSGIYRLNGSTDISAIEFKAPYVMARLRGAAPVLRERKVPPNTYTWVEVPTPSA